MPLPPNPGTPGSFHPLGKNPGDIIECATDSYTGAHWAKFPEKLIVVPILAGCPEGGTILDPFAGTFTVCEVARSLGRNAVGIDIDEANVKLWKNGPKRSIGDTSALDEFKYQE